MFLGKNYENLLLKRAEQLNDGTDAEQRQSTARDSWDGSHLFLFAARFGGEDSRGSNPQCPEIT